MNKSVETVETGGFQQRWSATRNPIPEGVRHIRHYPNRRHYDCLESRYTTLEEMGTWWLAGWQLIVTDSKGGDITIHALMRTVGELIQSGRVEVTAEHIRRLTHGIPKCSKCGA